MHPCEALAGNFFHDADDSSFSARRSKRVRRSVARLQPDPGHICLETLELQHRSFPPIKSICARCSHFQSLPLPSILFLLINCDLPSDIEAILSASLSTRVVAYTARRWVSTASKRHRTIVSAQATARRVNRLIHFLKFDHRCWLHQQRMQGQGRQDLEGRVPLCHPSHHQRASIVAVQALVSKSSQSVSVQRLTSPGAASHLHRSTTSSRPLEATQTWSMVTTNCLKSSRRRFNLR